jgi:hypothetical protein
LEVLAVFTIYWGYFVFFETIWSGQTPGKRRMRLRVVREDGRPVRFFEVLVRNLLRLTLDLLPPPTYAVGVVSIVFSPYSKRLGDYVAGTVVIKERATEAPSLEDIIKISIIESARLERSASSNFRLDPRRLTGHEVRAIEAFLKRRYELPEHSRSRLAARLAGPIVRRLGIETGQLTAEEVIEEIERQHRAKPYR